MLRMTLPALLLALSLGTELNATETCSRVKTDGTIEYYVCAQEPIQEQPRRTACGPFTTIEKQLAKEYSEHPFQIGLSSLGHLLYLFANPDTGTWTIVTRTPNGMGCMVDGGKHFGGAHRSDPPEHDALFTPASTTPAFDRWLVLIIDVSSSVDDKEYALQKEGYVNVMLDPMMARALNRTAIAVIEFNQTAHLISDWADLRDAGATYRAAPRADGVGTTCVACAIELALELLAGKPGKRVIDISADGCDNVRRTGAVRRLQEQATVAGVQINTLAILVQPDASGCRWSSDDKKRWEGDHALARWYAHLATGFSLIVTHMDDFERALRFKLHAEVAGLD